MSREMKVGCDTHCALPLRLDTYTLCPHNCVYCRSKLQYQGLSRLKGHDSVVKLDRTLDGMSKDQEMNRFVKQKTMIKLGTNCDPFPTKELVNRTTYRALRKMMLYNMQVRITTKSIIPATDKKTFDLICQYPKNICVVASVSVFDDKLAKKIEPGAPSPTERIAMLEKYAKAGIDTGIRLEPFIPGVTDYSQILKLKGKVKRLSCEPLAFIPCNDSGKNTLALCGVDFARYKAYWQHPTLPWYGAGNYFRYEYGRIRAEFLKIKGYCNQVKIPFGICNERHGLMNIDLSEGDFCCQTGTWQSYDKDALQPRYAHKRVHELMEGCRKRPLKDYFEEPEETTDTNIDRYIEIVTEPDYAHLTKLQ